MASFKQCGFIFQMLFSGLSDFLDRYWKAFEEKELSNCKIDEENGRNHCVYEQRIYEEKIDEENGSDGATIFSLIVPNPENPPKKEILCISAPKGFAKEFFAKRLCLLNHDEAKTQNGKAWRNLFCFQGRIPIIIRMQDINAWHDGSSDKTFGEYSELCLLCMNSMKRFVSENSLKWLKLFKQVQWSEKFEKKLLFVLSKLLDMGKLFILFEKNTNIHAEKLKRIVEEGLAERENEIQKNLLVFVFDDERDNPFDLGFYSVKLSPLSRKEVMDHIQKGIGGKTTGIWRDVDRLFDKIPALRIPDCLLFVMETHQNSIQKSGELRTAAELYRNCIMAVIEDRVPENIEETLRQLQNFALLKDGERHVVEGELKKLLPVQGKRNHLLHQNGQFRFEGSREYLNAESIYAKLNNSLSSEESGQMQNLLDGIDGNIVRRLIEIARQRCDNMGGTIALNKLSNYLFAVTEGKMNADLDVLLYFAEYTIDVESVDCEALFIDCIKRELLKPIYNDRIFDVITESNKRISAWKINSKLKNIYLESIKGRTKLQGYEEEDRFNRRFLFYYGTYNKLDEKILSGFEERDLHPHVKYHLARALIDNAIRAKREKNECNMAFFRRAQESMNNEEVKKDAILKGQRLALKHILGEKIYLLSKDEDLIHELESLLSHEDYWKRAHAADTLGHLESSDIREIPQKLIEAIENEIDREGEVYERKKVIGYTTEAVCVFFYMSFFLRNDQNGFRDMQEVGKGFGIEMFRMIQLKCLDQIENREFAMPVSAVLAEGGLYLTNQNYNEMPSFSGKHITNSEGRWDENTKLIIRTFECARDSCKDSEQKEEINLWLRNFLDRVDKIREEKVWVKKEGAEVSRRRELEMSDIEKSKNGLQGILKGGNEDKIFNVEKIENQQNNFFIYEKEGGAGMEIYNETVNNQQNIERGAIGVQVVENSKGDRIAKLEKDIKELLEKNDKEKLLKIDSVIKELSTAVDAGKVRQKDEEHWKNQFLTVLSAGANVATITSTSWWSSLMVKLHHFFSSFPFD